jgi:hypothetical protein
LDHLNQRGCPLTQKVLALVADPITENVFILTEKQIDLDEVAAIKRMK